MQHASLDDVLNSIPDGMVVLDRHFRILHCNITIQDWFSPEAPIPGRRCHELFYQASRPCDNCPAMDVFETGKPVMSRQCLTKPSGERCAIDIQASPICAPDGAVVFVVENMRDVTVQVQQEHLLQEREELYRSLFEQHSSVMLLMDPTDGTIHDANQTACRYYGYTREELTHKSIADINMLDPQQVMQEMAAAVASSRNFFKFRHQLSSGEIRDVEVFSGPVHLHGKPMLYSVIHDVTDRRIQEEERDRLLQELQQALEQVKTLEGYIPICSHCRKIRNDEGFWNKLERYVEDHSNAHFTHGLCPDCAQTLYGDQDWFQEMKASGKL